METFVLNYRIIIEPELEEKSGKKVYNAFCPKLGIGDWGKTVEEALSHIKEAIECHLESLIKHKKSIPAADSTEYMVATTEVYLPKGIRPSFC